MIRSWLDENYPSMAMEERARRAEEMDMSLIESKKTESLKTIYEINNVIRMSFIEAQFIKKVSFGISQIKHSSNHLILPMMVHKGNDECTACIG